MMLEDWKNNKKDIVAKDRKIKETKDEKITAGSMGDTDRHGRFSAEVNNKALGRNYKTGDKINKKGDNMTNQLRKLSSGRTS